MKRFLSILLAVMLVCTMLPTAFAEDTATEVVATERVYTINNTVVDKTIEGVWDTTMTGKYQQSSIFPLKGYGTHGYKFWDIDDVAFANLAKCERSMNFGATYLRFWSGCASADHPITNENGAKLALALEAPSKVASFYSLTVETDGSDGNATMSIYMDELDENKKKVEEYTLPENMIDSAYTFGHDTKSFDELVYSDGVSELLIAFGLNPTGLTRLEKITLTPVEVSGIDFKATRKEILPGEELALLVRATVGTATKSVSHSFVTYKSSNEDILTVDASGVVRGVSDGTATVTATVGSFSKSISISVGNKVYMMPAKYVDTTDSAVWDKNITNYSKYSSSPIPVKGYGSHGWKFFDCDDWTYSQLPVQTRLLQFQADNMRFFSEYGSSYTNPGLAKVAFVLEKPEQNGFYSLRVGVEGGDGAGDLTPYMSYVDDAKTTVEDYETLQNKLNETYNTTGSTGNVASKLIYADGENDLMLALTINGRTRLMQMTLIPQKKITDIKLDAPETVLLGETAVAVVFGAGTSLEVGNGFVTYESSNKDVATIDECGNITTLTEGKTTITATVGELTNSVELEVIKEDEELSGAFDYTEDEFASVPLTTAKVNTFTAKLGESKTSDSAVIESETATLGETCTVEAPEAEEGYKFLYWAKGMSTDKKQIVSYDESYSFIPTVENTYLIAVYEAVNGENAVNKAEFYNANGQLIETLTADGVVPALPEMAGYENCEGWALYGTNEVISAGTAVEVSGMKVYVAKFGAPKTVKVNGKDVAYGDKVSFTATPGEGQIFKAWKKDGVIVSTADTYSFYAWKDSNVEAVYVTEEFNFTGIARKILIDTFTAGTKNALMAEFIGFEDAVEKGIMLGEKRFAMTTNAGQFTLVNDIDETEVTGYAIFKDGTIVYDK